MFFYMKNYLEIFKKEFPNIDKDYIKKICLNNYTSDGYNVKQIRSELKKITEKQLNVKEPKVKSKNCNIGVYVKEKRNLINIITSKINPKNKKYTRLYSDRIDQN